MHQKIDNNSYNTNCQALVMNNIIIPQLKPITIPILLSKTSLSSFPVNRIYCIGRNYKEHAIEMGHDPNKEPPFFFMKPADSIIVSHPANSNNNNNNNNNNMTNVPYPPKTKSLHYEAELVIAIGKDGLHIPINKANEYIFGYCIGCDLTRRDLQKQAKELRRPWTTAKAFDYSAPMGYIIPKDEATTPCPTTLEELLPSNAPITLSVNGTMKQCSTIDQMIWNIPELISNISSYVRLKAGDLIMTGTPAGVSSLNVGDCVEIECGGLPKCTFTIGDPETE